MCESAEALRGEVQTRNPMGVEQVSEADSLRVSEEGRGGCDGCDAGLRGGGFNCGAESLGKEEAGGIALTAVQQAYYALKVPVMVGWHSFPAGVRSGAFG